VDYVRSGTACDDGDPCTSESFCDGSGRCVGAPLPAGSSCDDGNACTVQDSCGEEGTCLGQSLAVGDRCADESACSAGGACLQGADGGIVCEQIARECGDSNPCTLDTCDPDTGECRHEPLNCGDGNPCTTDACDSELGCVHAANGWSCDADGSPCTFDYCSGGNCFRGPECPTSSPCEVAYCSHEIGEEGCRYSPNDGIVCGGDECVVHVCFDGICQPGYLVNCDDGDPLTFDYCEAGAGCVHLPVCDDGNACTLDVRDPASGECSHHSFEGACEDGNACTTGDVCVEGVCRPGGAPDCDDANPCTDDSCAPATGCVHAANVLGCDDGDACTRGDVCREGVCAGGAITCDDGSACTLDACDPAVGCTSEIDPSLPDRDGDAVPDLCDNCPTITNSDQDPAACEQAVVNIVLARRRGRSTIGRSLSWRTTHEVDVRGFHVVEVEDGGESRQLNDALIPCSECTTGAGATYSLRLHGLGRLRGAVYIDLVRLDGRTERFGPAVAP
jgi:hypothetical protein